MDSSFKDLSIKVYMCYSVCNNFKYIFWPIKPGPDAMTHGRSHGRTQTHIVRKSVDLFEFTASRFGEINSSLDMHVRAI